MHRGRSFIVSIFGASDYIEIVIFDKARAEDNRKYQTIRPDSVQ